MMATSPLHRVFRLFVLFGAFYVAGEPAQAQASKPKKKSTTVQVPKVDVTASEGSTAGAIRGRPSPPAGGRAVNDALKTALAKPNVRAALRAEVLRQLRVNRPIALVDGHWVSAIKLVTAYRAPSVRPELIALLGPNGAQLIDAAGASTDGIIVAFTPAQLGRLLMGDIPKDLLGTFAPAAVRTMMTDITADNVLFVVTYGLGGLATGSLVDFARYLMNENSGAGAPSGNTGDLDGDGVPDSADQDDGGDGFDDDKDHYQRDSSKHICDCGRPAVFFGTSAGSDLLPGLLSTLGTARARIPQAVLLGAVAPGQGGSLALFF
jgi:hypothetical protein